VPKGKAADAKRAVATEVVEAKDSSSRAKVVEPKKKRVRSDEARMRRQLRRQAKRAGASFLDSDDSDAESELTKNYYEVLNGKVEEEKARAEKAKKLQEKFEAQAKEFADAKKEAESNEKRLNMTLASIEAVQAESSAANKRVSTVLGELEANKRFIEGWLYKNSPAFQINVQYNEAKIVQLISESGKKLPLDLARKLPKLSKKLGYPVK